MKLIQTHLSFMINKVTILFLSICLAIILLSTISSSNALLNYAMLEMNRSYYYQIYYIDMIFIIKITSVTLGIFLCVYMFSGAKKSYDVIFLSKGITSFEFVFTKLLSMLILMIYFLFCCFSIYIIIAKMLTPFSVNIIRDSGNVVSILFISYYYLLISCIFVQLTDSMFSGLVVLMFFWISELTVEYYISFSRLTMLEKIVHYVFPGLVLSSEFEYKLIYNGYHLFIITVFMMFVNILLYIYLDKS